MTISELQAERARLASIGAGWHELDETPVPDPQPTRKARRDASVAELRRAYYSNRQIEHATAHRGGPNA